jgi:hypothetical protein
MWRLLFFLSVGDGGKKEAGADHTLVPEPTPRAYRYVEHVLDTSYNGQDPVTMRQIWGQGTATTGCDALDR